MSRFVRFPLQYFYSMVSCIYLFTLGILSDRHRRLMRQICRHFGLEIPVVENLLPKIAMQVLLPQEPEIQVREWVQRDGNVALIELVLINKLIRLRSPHRLFEFGTFDGRTTLNLAVNSPSDAVVYTIDLPWDPTKQDKVSGPGPQAVQDPASYGLHGPIGNRFSEMEAAGKIIRLEGDSVRFDFSPYYGLMDFVFVDASHAYEAVLSDSRRAVRLLREGKGIILWHDYLTWEGVTRALNELWRTDPAFRGLSLVEGTSLACLVLE